MRKNNEIKIVLCTTPQDMSLDRKAGEVGRMPNIAIVSLLRWMAKFGYSGDFYDIDMLLPSEDEIFSYFKSKQPDVIGISAVVSASYLQVKTISAIMRRACPSAWIVLGGNMAVAANVLLRKAEVDICVLGDGEKPWVNILNYVSRHGTDRDMKELLKVKGIAFLNGQDEMEFTGYDEPIPSNEMPFPDYELLSKGLLSQPYLVENYFREGKKCSWFRHDARAYEPNRKPKVAILWTTKGCVARCTFCQRFCKGYHYFDLKKLDSHLAELKEKYNVQFLEIADESFGVNKEHGFKVAEILKKHDFLWFCGGVRCTTFTLEDLKFLNECGCTGIKFGVESGSQEILDVMEKKFTVDNVYTALKNAYECGIYSPILFCIGMPGETNHTVMKTGQFIGKVAQLQNLPPTPTGLEPGSVHAIPLPGAPLWEYGQLQGIIGSSVDEEEAFLIYVSQDAGIINLSGASAKDYLFFRDLMHCEAMRTFYRSPVKKQIARIDNKPENKNESLFTIIKNVIRSLPVCVTILNTRLSRSPLVTKVPRPLLYPVMRNLAYAEYSMRLFFKHLFKIKYRKEQPLVKLQPGIIGKRLEPIMKGQSLREINRKIRETLPPAQSLTEKNQQILCLGR